MTATYKSKKRSATPAIILGAALSVSLLAACSQHSMHKMNVHHSQGAMSKSMQNATNNSMLNTPMESNIIREMDITFTSGKIIEIAYFSLKEGKEAQIQKHYFPKIMPLMAKYGGKILGNFEVSTVTGGEISPQMIGIFEWPSLDAQKQLLNDNEAKKLFPIRDDALSFIKLAYFTVDKDATVTFKTNKTYEFFNAWLTPAAKTSLPEYFKRSAEPKKRFGSPKFLVSLKPFEKAPNRNHVLKPQMSGIVEWSNTNDYYGLIADPVFKQAEPYLKESTSRLDMLHTKVSVHL